MTSTWSDQDSQPAPGSYGRVAATSRAAGRGYDACRLSLRHLLRFSRSTDPDGSRDPATRRTTCRWATKVKGDRLRRWSDEQGRYPPPSDTPCLAGLLSASFAGPQKAGSTSHGAQNEQGNMITHALAHPPAILITSGRPSGLHPIRHAQGAILGLLEAPARRCEVTPSPCAAACGLVMLRSDSR